MKHKHYDKIVAKAANTDLVVFYRYKNDEWEEAASEMLVWDVKAEHFLCLPQHKEAVLNSLNGGDSELSFDGEYWTDCNCNQPIEWNSEWWYMRPQSQSRIKPKKEKRWIGVREGSVTPRSFLCKDNAMFWVDHNSDASSDYWQFIEIEVEV